MLPPVDAQSSVYRTLHHVTGYVIRLAVTTADLVARIPHCDGAVDRYRRIRMAPQGEVDQMRADKPELALLTDAMRAKEEQPPVVMRRRVGKPELVANNARVVSKGVVRRLELGCRAPVCNRRSDRGRDSSGAPRGQHIDAKGPTLALCRQASVSIRWWHSLGRYRPSGNRSVVDARPRCAYLVRRWSTCAIIFLGVLLLYSIIRLSTVRSAYCFRSPPSFRHVLDSQRMIVLSVYAWSNEPFFFQQAVQ